MELNESVNNNLDSHSMEWEINSLEDLAFKIGSGITPRGGSSVYKSIGRPFVRSQNIGWGNLKLEDIAFIEDEIHQTFSNTEIKLNDVFLNISGASIGRSSYANDKLVGGNVNQHVCIIRTIPEKLDHTYLSSYLLSSFGQKQIDSFQSGGNREGLNIGQIRSFKIPTPPLPEQQAIAKVLSDTDKLIQSLENKIAKKKLIKQGVMQQLLTPKEGWNVKKLGDLFEITAGGDLRENEFSSIQTKEYPFPIYSNAHTNQGLYGFCKTFDYESNALTISARGGIGFTRYRESRFAAIGRLLVLKPNDGINVRFVELYIESMVHFANESTGVPQLTAPQVSKYEISFPSSEQQNEISHIIYSMNMEIKAIEKQFSKYNKTKQALIQQLLTGKIRLSC
ncbi:MAG: restriction endonuclease subunit S [Cyclobacteriaceae bacterium]